MLSLFTTRVPYLTTSFDLIFSGMANILLQGTYKSGELNAIVMILNFPLLLLVIHLKFFVTLALIMSLSRLIISIVHVPESASTLRM